VAIGSNDAQPEMSRAMPIRSSLEPGAFEPEALATMSEVFEAACRELHAIHREVAREVIAVRIIAEAKFGERDPARLLEAALSRQD